MEKRLNTYYQKIKYGHMNLYDRIPNLIYTLAEVVKLVDTLASGASDRKVVAVRVCSSVPLFT